jgi:hypothetical protein
MVGIPTRVYGHQNLLGSFRRKTLVVWRNLQRCPQFVISDPSVGRELLLADDIVGLVEEVLGKMTEMSEAFIGA